MGLPRVRFTERRMMVAIPILIAVALLASARCRRGTVSEWNYAKVEIGMTVAQADALLGPGREIGREYVPSTRLGPVVAGDRYFLWEETAFGRGAWAGLTGDRIIAKWYWEPSF